jgi:uncharacterized membrane protein YoaK (UPF0700 family)
VLQGLTRRLIARAAGLCLVAGFVDAVGYTELGGVFAANMTGNSVLFAVAAVRGEGARAASYAATLAAFLMAAIIGSVLRRTSGRSATPLLAAVVLLTFAAAAPMNTTPRLILLAATMGLQGAAVTRFGPASLQTVVVTGTMCRLADNIVDHILPATIQKIGTTRLDAAAWLGYAAGAGLAIGVAHIMAKPLLVAAVVLLIITLDVARDERAGG